MLTFTRARAVALVPALALAGATAQTALGQHNFGPPVGVPFGRSIVPPTENVEDFLGTWKISWTGSVGSNCPLSGHTHHRRCCNDELMDYWETRSGTYVLRGRSATTRTPGPAVSRNPTTRPTSPSEGSFS